MEEYGHVVRQIAVYSGVVETLEFVSQVSDGEQRRRIAVEAHKVRNV